jgi:hypothetical protein
MNQLLSLLLAYVFLQSQCWALSGGPVFSGSQQSLVGTYAGALLPSDGGLDDTASTGTGTTTGTTTGASASANGLGLFTLSVPQTGLGTGDFVYFSEGRTFTGTITGLADPERNQLIGLLKGQFDVITGSTNINDNFFGNASLVSSQPGGFANGQIQADFVGGSAVSATSAGGATVAGLRLEGSAVVEISEPRTVTTTTGTTTTATAGGGTVGTTTTPGTSTTSNTVVTTSTLNLIVDGFQQSTTATGTASLGATAP